MEPIEPPAAPSFREAFWFWLRLGFISFGGPAGQIAIMHDFLVDKKRWISNFKFLHALNYCMLLPGPEAQQLATYTGWLLHGTRGGLAAGLLFVLPSALLLWGLSAAYVTWGKVAVAQSIFGFLKPAVVAIIIGALLKIGKKSLHTPWHYAVAAGAFISVYFFSVPFPLVILGAMLAGVFALYVPVFQQRSVAQQIDVQDEAENTWLINRHRGSPNSGFSGRRLAAQIFAGVVLWAWPLVCFGLWSGDFDFWRQLSLFFTKAALVTFGGAYAVLPYVAQVSVEQFGWLTHLEMLDGLALGETTPGPLIMVLAFVGFMAGHTHSGGSFAMASLGLATTVYYTFLPSFLFIFIGAPLIEKTGEHPGVRSVLQFTTAAVTGVILSLGLYFGQAVIAPQGMAIQWLSLVWLLISLAALQYFKTGMMTWIGVSALAGLILYFAGAQSW